MGVCFNWVYIRFSLVLQDFCCGKKIQDYLQGVGYIQAKNQGSNLKNEFLASL